MTEWMYLHNGRSLGPIPESQIVEKLVSAELDFDTNVMDTKSGIWKKIRDIQSIMDKFNAPGVKLDYKTINPEDMEKVLTGDIPHNIYFYVPVKRILLMTLASFGLYQLYWWYKQWSYWAAKKKMSRSFDREAGWFLFELIILDKIALDPELNKVERANFNGQSLFAAWLLLCFLGSIPFMFFHSHASFDPTMFGGAFSLSVLLLIPPQKYINRVNAKLGNSYDKPGLGHYACLIIGGLLWIGEIIFLVKYFVQK